jgi:hypothetical protein
MKESKVSAELTMRWVPVVDARGRTRMEAVWVTPRAMQTTHAA